MPTIWTLFPQEGMPEPRKFNADTIEQVLPHIAEHFRARSKLGHKERIDLAALREHSGINYAQVEAVPADLHERMRKLEGIKPMVLMPPNQTGTASAGADGVIFLLDAYGAVKGLPVNKKGSMVLNACGRRQDVRGDVFIARFGVT